jgi:hypothetical protein
MPISINNQSLVNMSVYTNTYLDSNEYNKIMTATSVSWPESLPFQLNKYL